MKILKLFIYTIIITLSLFSFTCSADKNKKAPPLTVKVTEQIPGGNCKVAKKDDNGNAILYECTIEKGFDSVMGVFNKMLKYITFIASLGGVLFIVINGIAISTSGIDSSAKEAAKGRIIKTILGLIVLLLSGTLLNIIAPWVFK